MMGCPIIENDYKSMTNRWEQEKDDQIPSISLEAFDRNEELRNVNESPSLYRLEEEMNIFTLAKHTSGTQILPEAPSEQTAPRPRGRRAVRQIAGIEYVKMQAISERRKGSSKETANLSKYVFREVRGRLLLLATTNQLGERQLQRLREFEGGRGNLKSYAALFEEAVFHRACLRMAESTEFVRRVLTSRRMGVESKLLVIKFLERIRGNCVSPKGKWKERDII